MNAIDVDARGLRCPLPVIRLAAAARDAPAGTRIIVLATDPAARYDVPAWCRMRGHELREITEVPDPSRTDAGMDMVGLPAPVVPDPSRTDAGPAEGARPAYLRFVVVVRPQSSKPAGEGSESERSSRPT